MTDNPNTLDVDLTRGAYRRQYSGFKTGQRINKLSMDAEGWFWRVHSEADDYGNYFGNPHLVMQHTMGLRKTLGPNGTGKRVTVKLVESWLKEMYEAGLIALYWHNDEQYLHFHVFERWQPPMSRNGKRVQRFPRPTADQCKPVQTGASNAKQTIQADQDQNNDQDQDHPLPFGSAEFLEAWSAWERHKKEKRSKLTTEARRLIFGRFRKWGEERAIAAIYHSIEKNWQGIFEEKAPSASGDNSKVGHTLAAGERVREAMRKERDERNRRTS
jgi:hypothetical protein